MPICKNAMGSIGGQTNVVVKQAQIYWYFLSAKCRVTTGNTQKLYCKRRSDTYIRGGRRMILRACVKGGINTFRVLVWDGSLLCESNVLKYCGLLTTKVINKQVKPF